jgi:hypothetical protein
MIDKEILLNIGRRLHDTSIWSFTPHTYIDMYRDACILIVSTLSFTDRTSYLVWRRDWRFQYNMLAQELRRAKYAYRGKGALVFGEKWKQWKDLCVLRSMVTAMLEIRKLSKLESNRQRNARRTP